MFFYKEIDVGDFIWLKKDDFRQEDGPAIIIKKTTRRLYALQCTFKEQDDYFKIGKINELYRDDAYVILDHVLVVNEDNFDKKIDFIEPVILNKLMKKLAVILQSKKIKNLTLKDLKIEYEAGDVLLYNDKLYIVYSNINEQKYECYELFKKKGINSFKINNELYTIKFNKPVFIMKDEEILLSYFAIGDEQQKLVSKLKQEKYYFLHNQGNIVNKDNRYYLIYSDKKAIRLGKYDRYERKIGEYSTNYGLVDFIMDSKAKVIKKISLEEFTELEKVINATRQKKEYKIVDPETIILNEKLHVGRVVAHSKIPTVRYLIVDRDDKTLYLMSFIDYNVYVFRVDSLGGEVPFKKSGYNKIDYINMKLKYEELKLNKKIKYIDYRDFYDKYIEENKDYYN